MERARTIYLINGPNLGRLGSREPEVYGAATLEEVEAAFSEQARQAGYEPVCIQSDSEGEIVGAIHRAVDEDAAVVINPGAFTHYSYAIADALAQVRRPVVEVHISNPASREAWRRTSVVSPYVTGTISGFGTTSYLLALQAVEALDAREEGGENPRSRRPPRPTGAEALDAREEGGEGES